jgi:hypothetical protein
MSKTTKVVGELELKALKLPAKTATYTVISHGFIIDEVRRELAKAGYTIKSEDYRASNNLEIATGSYIINKEEDPSFAMSFSWVNSYDKSTRFQCAVGGFVWENNGYVIDKEDNGVTRKHTGDANAIVQETIKEKIGNADKFYASVHADKEQMMDITLTRSEVAKILGELFFSYDMLSIEQLSGIKKEYIKPSYMYTTDADSLWTIYCHMLTVIKGSHPKIWLSQQAFIHNYLKMNYLGKAPVKGLVPVEFKEPEPLAEKDPAQIDLLDQIAEVEAQENFFNISEEIPTEEPVKEPTPFWSTFKISAVPYYAGGKVEDTEPELTSSITSEEVAASVKFSEDVEINTVLPKTNEELVAKYNAEHDDSKMNIEYLSPEEVTEKYGADVSSKIKHPELTDDTDEITEFSLAQLKGVKAPEDIVIHVETDEEYDERVAAIEGEPEEDYVIVGDEIWTNDEEPQKIATILDETVHYTDPAGNTFELPMIKESKIEVAESKMPQEIYDALMDAPEMDVSEVDMSKVTLVDAPEVNTDKVTDATVIKFIQEEVNNIFGDETEITVYLNGDNYDAVTADDQIISVPVAYINNLI